MSAPEQHLGQLLTAEVAAGAAALHVAGHAAEQLVGEVELEARRHPG